MIVGMGMGMGMKGGRGGVRVLGRRCSGCVGGRGGGGVMM